ncbi:MAG: beta-ketoacyl-[acyl-carrier-protein] synthase family protein [Verrucomicrobia bacterium]|nr:beta-ketoacyl-[acyl-carrier-protein] synthase family protein [Verrucomicrobiota bacterium]
MLFPRPKTSSTPRRVVVTGAGIVTGLGRGWDSNLNGFRNGLQSFRSVTLFDVSRQRARIASEVDLPLKLPATKLSARRVGRLDRATTMLLLASVEAWNQSGWKPNANTPLVLGTTGCGMTQGESYLTQAIKTPLSQRLQATRIVNYLPQHQALDVCDALGFGGPITIIANACASGANAIGHAWQMIRNGESDRVLTGGFDALCHLIYAGFDSLHALSPSPCRPFDAKRDGLTLGEGAGILAMETLESAQARDAAILGEIAGYAASTDIHHLTQPHPQGNAAFDTMTGACEIGNITPHEVDYLNAHGTATPHNDSTEAAAINRWAGKRASTLPVSSTKASIGHTLGAAGAVEAVVSLMALQEQFLPPELGLETVDAACLFPIVRRKTNALVTVVMSNSFGFGGANATLLLKRWL